MSDGGSRDELVARALRALTELVSALALIYLSAKFGVKAARPATPEVDPHSQAGGITPHVVEDFNHGS